MNTHRDEEASARGLLFEGGCDCLGSAAHFEAASRHACCAEWIVVGTGGGIEDIRTRIQGEAGCAFVRGTFCLKGKQSGGLGRTERVRMRLRTWGVCGAIRRVSAERRSAGVEM